MWHINPSFSWLFQFDFEWHFPLLSVTRKISNLAFPFCLLLSSVLSLYLNLSLCRCPLFAFLTPFFSKSQASLPAVRGRDRRHTSRGQKPATYANYHSWSASTSVFPMIEANQNTFSICGMGMLFIFSVSPTLNRWRKGHEKDRRLCIVAYFSTKAEALQNRWLEQNLCQIH